MTPSVNAIKAATCRAFGCSNADLEGERRFPKIVIPRQLAMSLARLGVRSFAQVGSHFGGRDHSTVIHAMRATDARVRRDPAFALKAAETLANAFIIEMERACD